MSEKPRGLSPEELFGDLEQDEGSPEGAKSLAEDTSVEQAAAEAVRELRYDSETKRTAKAEAEIEDIKRKDKEAAAEEEAPKSEDLDLSDLEEEPEPAQAEAKGLTAEEEPEFEITVEGEEAKAGQAEEEDILIEEAGTPEAREAIGNLYDQLQEKRRAGQEPSESDIQRLLGEMAEQAALDKYGTTEPLDNITDSQGNRVDFWNVKNEALKEMRNYLAYEDFDGALDKMSRRLKEWVPEYKKIAPAGGAEKPALEIKVDDKDLANRQNELQPVVESLKSQPDSAVNDSLVTQAFKNTADYLTLGNEHITTALRELSEHLPDASTRGSLEKAKQYLLDRLAADYPNVRGNFRKQLEQGDTDSAVRFLANQMNEHLPLIIEKAKTHAAKAEAEGQAPTEAPPAEDRSQAAAQREKLRKAMGAGSARKEAPKKKPWYRRWFGGGRKAA